ncbi:hypothetical protein NKH73_03100 [Mesorhizobium sp. M0938]|uniref:hypothetical protein n=1 Tax=unclassified Mesorhizobium TaxID=325217 RepID=UPI00333D96D5
MPKSYIASISVSQIDVVDDGNPSGGLLLWSRLGCSLLDINYYLFDYQNPVKSGDTVKSRPGLFQSLFTKTSVSSKPKVQFEFEISGSHQLNGQSIYHATATMDIDLSKNSEDTVWWLETHANSKYGGTAKVKIHFRMKTYAVDYATDGFPTVWGCRDTYGRGPIVNLVASERKVDAYPIGEDSGNFQRGVWRTNYDQLGAVGNDQISSLVGGTSGSCVVFLYEHAFGDPKFASGMKKVIRVGGVYDRVANLPYMGTMIPWPPKPTMNDRISSVEVAIPVPPPIH